MLLPPEMRWTELHRPERLPEPQRLRDAGAWGFTDALERFIAWGQAIASPLTRVKPDFRGLSSGIATFHAYFSADRYLWDFELCRLGDGWRQFDTEQDAPYFGIWVHPERRLVVSYIEGEVYVRICLYHEALVRELERMGQLYGDPPPAAIVVAPAGTLTEYYEPRPTA